MSDNNSTDKVTFFKRRRSQHKLKERDAKLQSQKAKSSKAAKTKFLSPGHFLKNNLKKAKETRRLNRLVKHDIQPKVPDNEKVFLVIRNKSIGLIPKPCQVVFKHFRLERVNTAIFIKANKANLEKIQLVKPYVTYGEPNIDSIKSLIYKRGKTIINEKRKDLDNNTIVEEKLGEIGLICLEDLVHEISTNGPHFDQVAQFLAPFEFPVPRNKKPLEKISSTVIDKSTEKERAKYVNELISKIN